MSEEQDYEVYTDDVFLPGRKMQIEHTVDLPKYDISELLQKPPEEIRALYQKSKEGENTVHEIVQAAMKQWEQQAAITQRLMYAVRYLDISAVQHTDNQWIEDENGKRTISNSVYKMTCQLTENTRWNLWNSSALNKRWHVEWEVSLNTPKAHHHIVIAGQERNFMDRTDAENYMNGRIRAHAKYFTELSPPVPEKHKIVFMESNMLLPGYHLEGQEPKQEKPSVLGKLSEAKKQEKTAPAPKKTHEPER